MFLHYLNKHLFPRANDDLIKIHNLHQEVTTLPCSDRNMKKEYTNALADTRPHNSGKRIHLYKKQQHKNTFRKGLKKHKEDKQGWKPCPAATISSETWWVFSFKLVRSSASRQHYLGICHSHIKLPPAASSQTEWGARWETSQFSGLDWWGSGWKRGCEMYPGETRDTSKCAFLCPQKTCITKYHMVFLATQFQSSNRCRTRKETPFQFVNYGPLRIHVKNGEVSPSALAGRRDVHRATSHGWCSWGPCLSVQSTLLFYWVSSDKWDPGIDFISQIVL